MTPTMASSEDPPKALAEEDKAETGPGTVGVEEEAPKTDTKVVSAAAAAAAATAEEENASEMIAEGDKGNDHKNHHKHHKHHHKHHHHDKKQHSKKHLHSPDPEGIPADGSKLYPRDAHAQTEAHTEAAPLPLNKKQSKRLSVDPEGVEVTEAVYMARATNQYDGAVIVQEVSKEEPEENDAPSKAEKPDKDAEKPPDALATVSEVFTFAQTTKVKLCIALGFFCAAVSGCVFPALAWVFADSFQSLSGIAVEGFDFMKQIRELAYTLLVLGAVAFIFMTLQAALLETAAGEMTEALKTQWFQALLRQDMAYYDITDVSGTATIININGKKYRK